MLLLQEIVAITPGLIVQEHKQYSVCHAIDCDQMTRVATGACKHNMQQV